MSSTHAPMLKIINQVFELEKKLHGKAELAGLQRHVERIRTSLEEMGWQTGNPLGEPYTETRTDCEASIAGEISGPLQVTSVIKPIVYLKEEGQPVIMQKGVVIVASK